MNAARGRRPTIRRIRDTDGGPSLSPARVPLDLVPPPSSASWRESVPTLAVARPYYEEDDDEDDKATLARFIPFNSEVRGILANPELTLEYMRKVQASIPDPDSALDSLVEVYEKRVERLERERSEALVIVARVEVAEEKVRDAAAMKKPMSRSDRAFLKMQPHVWKIVYSVICVWGLIQLTLTR